MKIPTAQAIARTVIALIIGGVSLWLLIAEAMLGKDSHTQHLFLFAGGVLVGVAIGLPAVFFSTAKQIVVLIPEVRIGGRRYSDPPKTGESQVPKPEKDEGVP